VFDVLMLYCCVCHKVGFGKLRRTTAQDLLTGMMKMILVIQSHYFPVSYPFILAFLMSVEFDPYGESSKGLAEIMEAEKRRVVNGVRESLRNEQQYAEQEQQYAEKEQQSAQQEQPYSQEEHVPLWRRRGSNAEATIQSHAQAHAQAAQAQAHAQAQAAQAQAQTHALNQINQAQAEAAQAQAAQAQCLPQSHMPGQVKAMWLVVYGGWCASGIALLLQSVQDDN
jgi:uncharacterized membrane protein YqiK